jgi:hypothetical protein
MLQIGSGTLSGVGIARSLREMEIGEIEKTLGALHLTIDASQI